MLPTMHCATLILLHVGLITTLVTTHVRAYWFYTLGGNGMDCDPETRGMKLVLQLDSALIHGSYVKIKGTVPAASGPRTVCSFSVEPPPGYRVLVTVQKMFLVAWHDGSCEESVEFSDGRNSVSGVLCGRKDQEEIRTARYPSWIYSFNTSSTMHVDLATIGGVSAEKTRRDFSIEMAFVAFQECMGYSSPPPEWQRCSGTYFCLRESMFCDGIVNCPATIESRTDEFYCRKETLPELIPDVTMQVPSHKPQNRGLPPDKIAIYTIIPIILAVLLLGIFAHCKRGRHTSDAETVIPEAANRATPPTALSTDPPEYHSVVEGDMPALARRESLPPRYETLFPSS